MYWQFRYLRNTLIACVPGYQRLRQLKRIFLPYDASLDEWTLEQGLQMIDLLARAGRGLHGATVLELGSGWKPVIALLFRLAGAERVILTDAERLLDARLLAATARLLAERSELLSTRLGLTEETVRSTLEVSASRELETVAAKFGFTYLAPCDARQLPLATGEVDVVVSRAVLEHIPREVLQAIFDEFRRVLAPGTGFMCHIIDNSDHWAHHDRRLSMVNFLRYSNRAWKWFAKNPLDFMNRMRHFEYLALVNRSGFEIVLDDSVPDRVALTDLERIPVSEDFRAFKNVDMAILTSQVVARRAAD